MVGKYSERLIKEILEDVKREGLKTVCYRRRIAERTVNLWIQAAEARGEDVTGIRARMAQKKTEVHKRESDFVEPITNLGISSDTLSTELSALVALAQATRVRLQNEMRQASSVERDHIQAFEALSRSTARLLGEVRQIEKSQTKEHMSETEIFQTLIDNGWSPPKDWVPPAGFDD